jgi:oligopeptide transport system substrate-binding protein
MKRIMAVLLTVLLFTGFALGCGGGASKGGDFIVNNGAEPASLDPQLVEGDPENNIYLALFDGLVTYNAETAEPVPGIAEKWDISADGMTYTFHLRDAKWSDGKKITADDFVKSWLRILNPDTASPYAWFTAMFVKGGAEYNAGTAGPEGVKVKAIDEKTFQFETVGPFPYTLGALTHYAFAVVPMHVIEKFGADWVKPENIVTNGPFTVKEYIPQERLVVEKSKTYWNKKSVKLDTVTFLPIDDNNTGYNMYLNKEVDWQRQVPLDQLDSAKLREDYHVSPALITYYYELQQETAPMTDVKVRKALSLAIDRRALIDVVLKEGQIPAYGIVPKLAGYEPLTGKLDIAGAKKLLEEAGFKDGKGFPTISILYNTSEGHKKIAEFVQQQWEANLGIKVNLENQEWQTYLDNRNAGNYQVARAAWQGDYQDPNTFLELFISTSGQNGTGFKNKEYDKMLADAAKMPAGKDRMAKLKAAETLFIETNQSIIPLYYYVRANMIDTKIWGGWYDNTLDIHPVRWIYKK